MHDETHNAWKDLIIEHSQFPRGQHEISPASHQGKGENPFCGDRATVQLRVDGDDSIAEIGCLASGCAISIASASLLAEHVSGLTMTQAQTLFEQVRGMLTGADPEANMPAGLEALQLVRQYPSRVKCATLAWHVLHQALQGDTEPVTTE